MRSSEPHRAEGVAIRELLCEQGPAWGLSVLAGREGLSRMVRVPRIQKPGLALAGYVRQIHPDRIQVIGRPELAYLSSRSPAVARRAVDRLCKERVACFIVTNGAAVPANLTRAARATRIPLLRTRLASGVLIRAVNSWLEEKLAPRITVHGVLVQVFGFGVLLLGRSGIGKSETALDLVSRGHRLVADDVLEVTEVSPLALRGRCPELIRHHMEIRGLGIIDVRELFGALATMDAHTIDLVVELVPAEDTAAATRLGIDEERHTLLHVAVPLVRLATTPGRNLAILIEVAVRNQQLKARGRFAARELAAAVSRRTQGRRSRSVA